MYELLMFGATASATTGCSRMFHTDLQVAVAESMPDGGTAVVSRYGSDRWALKRYE
jgi:hypothetical protein